MKAKTIKAVPVKKDGSVFAIVLLDENGNEATIEFPATEFHTLARGVQAIARHIPDEAPSATGTGKSFPITKYAIGEAFPEGMFLMLQTEAFGRTPFAFPPDIGLEIAAALRACAEPMLEDQTIRKKPS